MGENNVMSSFCNGGFHVLVNIDIKIHLTGSNRETPFSGTHLDTAPEPLSNCQIRTDPSRPALTSTSCPAD